MPLVDILKGSFAAGELSPLVTARPDVQRYQHGALQLENWVVLTQGGVTRRPGLRHVALAKYPGTLCLVKAFEPSTTDAYMLEIGAGYIRFYKNGAQLTDGGVPVEVSTPYAAADLRLLRTAQSNDIMLFVHPDYAPRQLARLSDTSWVFRTIPFDPPPVYEAGEVFAVALSLSGLTGSITVTASASVFFLSDVQRQFTSGIGRAIITGYTSATVVTASVQDAFVSTTIASGAWTLQGSPVAQCTPSRAMPLGAEITLTLGAYQPDLPTLMLNGDFSAGLANYANLSGPEVTSGTHTGSVGDDLIDTAATFLDDAVLATHLIFNDDDGSSGVAATVTQTGITLGGPGLLGGTLDQFSPGDAYRIRQTGSAQVVGTTCFLSGGSAGIGWISQGIPTTVGASYTVAFSVSDAPLALQIGTSQDTNDTLAEATYGLGDHQVLFTATGTTSHLQFRNNQSATAKLSHIVVTPRAIDGWRTSAVGGYVALNGGLVRVTAYTSASEVVGQIVKPLSTEVAAAAGAWSLLQPAWSDANGWPSAVVLYEGRLYFAGNSLFPQTLWGSVIDDFFNFAVGPLDDDALQLSIVDSGGNITLNRIRWLMPAENMLVGTTHGEYRLIGSADDPLTPRLVPRVRLQSTFGSDVVQPLKIGAALIFAQRQGSKIREMGFDITTNTTYVARDITVLSEHLVREARVVELAYQQEPISTLYAVRADGVLLAATYDRSEEVLAWYPLTTQGTFWSVATIPHPSGNAHQIWVSVDREGGTAIEYFDPSEPMGLPIAVNVWNATAGAFESRAFWQGLTVDAAVVYQGSATATLTGLDHLEGHDVVTVGNGVVFPAQEVVGGQITLPTTVTSAFVGLSYAARGQTLPVEVPLRGTTGQRSRKRWVELTARLYESLALVVNGQRLSFRTPDMPQDQGEAPFTGDKRVTPLGWTTDGRVTFVAADPLPCTLLGLIGVLDIEAEPHTAQRGA